MKIPYPQTAAVAIEQREQFMQHAISLGLPRLKAVPIDDEAVLHVACYGPSLEQTWHELRHPIISMSGATQWLAQRGVIADYHVDMDPRPNKVFDVDPVIPGVNYLMASVCCPQVFAKLHGYPNVTLWHSYSGKHPCGDTYDWVRANDPDRENDLVIHAGSTIGLTALHIGGLLGFRHFEIHGMDGSFSDLSRAKRHAGPHTGHKQDKDGQIWPANGTTYATSKIMANAVAETINTMRSYPIFCVFHGDGLTQALIKEAKLPNACCADEADKAAFVRRARARFVALPPASNDAPGMRTFWDALLAQPEASQWMGDVLAITRDAEKRRELARYNTGSVPIETALLLRALCGWYKPRIAVEVGTFIGTSTLALHASDCVYTCDRDNDCLPSTDKVKCHPLTTSTQMLERLVNDGVSVDLFFFDGRIQPGDCPLIMRLSHPGTVYAFDDFIGKEKGVINAVKMMTFLPRHVLVEPSTSFEGRTTLAALVPQTA